MEDNLILLKMEDDLIFLKIEDYLIFLTVKDDLHFLKMEDYLIFIQMEDDLIKCNFNQQRSTGNLTNTTTKNILAQLKRSTLIGCDITVN